MTEPGPPPVLLPGLHGSGALWTGFRKAWSGPLREVAYRADPEASLDDYADQVERSVQGSGAAGSAVDLIAESFSGPVALRVKRRRQIPVRRLVMVASFAETPHPFLLSAYLKVPPIMLNHARLVRILIAKVLINGHRDAVLAADIAAVVRSLSPQVIRSRLRLLQGIKAEADCCACPGPGHPGHQGPPGASGQPAGHQKLLP